MATCATQGGKTKQTGNGNVSSLHLYQNIAQANSVLGLTTLEVLAATLMTYGVLLSDEAKNAIRVRYGVGGDESGNFIKV